MYTSLNNTKILVSGGAGFIGSNLCEELLSINCEVVCLDNFWRGQVENILSSSQKNRFRLIIGNILIYKYSKKTISRVDVLHKVALNSATILINNYLADNYINTFGLLSTLTAAKETKIKKFIYAIVPFTYNDYKLRSRIGYKNR